MEKIQESKLGEYLYSQHGLVLLGSEIDDILALARQEIELPDAEEVRTWFSNLNYTEAYFCGAMTALRKVRNPYPKPMHFHRDDEEGITG